MIADETATADERKLVILNDIKLGQCCFCTVIYITLDWDDGPVCPRCQPRMRVIRDGFGGTRYIMHMDVSGLATIEQIDRVEKMKNLILIAGYGGDPSKSFDIDAGGWCSSFDGA